jgi:ABC-type lipoprotein export system ATPase subunit
MIKKSKPVEIDFNPGFQSALSLMEETEKNIFITGRAGTGKSTLLNYF